MIKIKRFRKENLLEMARTNIDPEGKISIHTYGDEFEKEPHFHFYYRGRDGYKASLTIRELRLTHYKGYTKQYRQKMISKKHLLIIIGHLESQHSDFNCTNWIYHIKNWNICNQNLSQVNYKIPDYRKLI